MDCLLWSVEKTHPLWWIFSMLGVLEIGSQSQISKRPIIINCYLYRVLCCFQDTFTCLLTCNTHNNFGRWVSSSFYRERKWTSDSDWLSQVTEDRKVKKLRLKLPHFKFRLPLINIYTYIYIYIWRRQWHPTPVLLPGKSHGWRSLVGCSPWSL